MRRISDTGGISLAGRVLVIGLDGATFDLIEPWAEAGHLPNLARLMAEGAWGRMQSTVPAHSAPAWVSFATGLLPGRHGIYWFLGPTRDRQYFRPVSADSIRGQTLWQIASDQGLKAGVINIPLTYPPRPLNGYLISGVLSPSAREAFWPPELYEEVTRECGEYVVEVYGKLNRRAHFEAIMAALDQRRRVAEYLLEHHPVDLFVVMFRMLDSIQHKFWADMDPNHPLHGQAGSEALPDAILDCYRLLDSAVGRLWEKAGPDATVVVISDHGFRGEYRTVALNKWLLERGLAAWQRKPGTALGRAVGVAKRLGVSQVLGSVARTVAGARYRRLLPERMNLIYRSIDWSSTQVVFGPGFGFNINLQGRDPQGIVPPSEYEALRNRLIQEITALRDPDTGLPVVTQLYRREEVYQGDAVDQAPDLVPEMAEYTANGHRWGYGTNLNPFAQRVLDVPAQRMGGNHASDGIFAACGPHLQTGGVPALRIADVAPTVLYLLGLLVPNAMDGQVRTELCDSEYVVAHPVRYEDTSDASSTGQAGQVLSDEQEALVEERLRGLGYL